jgi:hypothetical protein
MKVPHKPEAQAKIAFACASGLYVRLFHAGVIRHVGVSDRGAQQPLTGYGRAISGKQAERQAGRLNGLPYFSFRSFISS